MFDRCRRTAAFPQLATKKRAARCFTPGRKLEYVKPSEESVMRGHCHKAKMKGGWG